MSVCMAECMAMSAKHVCNALILGMAMHVWSSKSRLRHAAGGRHWADETRTGIGDGRQEHVALSGDDSGLPDR